jgi:hypothetical protein
MKSGIIMTMNSCKNSADFTEQMISEYAVLYMKNNKTPSSYGHMLALPFT